MSKSYEEKKEIIFRNIVGCIVGLLAVLLLVIFAPLYDIFEEVKITNLDNTLSQIMRTYMMIMIFSSFFAFLIVFYFTKKILLGFRNKNKGKARKNISIPVTTPIKKYVEPEIRTIPKSDFNIKMNELNNKHANPHFNKPLVDDTRKNNYIQHANNHEIEKKEQNSSYINTNEKNEIKKENIEIKPTIKTEVVKQKKEEKTYNNDNITIELPDEEDFLKEKISTIKEKYVIEESKISTQKKEERILKNDESHIEEIQNKEINNKQKEEPILQNKEKGVSNNDKYEDISNKIRQEILKMREELKKEESEKKINIPKQRDDFDNENPISNVNPDLLEEMRNNIKESILSIKNSDFVDVQKKSETKD